MVLKYGAKKDNRSRLLPKDKVKIVAGTNDNCGKTTTLMRIRIDKNGFIRYDTTLVHNMLRSGLQLVRKGKPCY